MSDKISKFTKAVGSYTDETTLHAFRYLSGRAKVSACKGNILAWLSFTLMVVLVMCLIIYQDLRDMAKHNIRTQISLRHYLRPTSEIPFPAITLTLSDAADPMSIIKQSGNLIPREALPKEGLL